jgi:CheY-like chemotaxis protein/serine phosphatase RsbU (regulator of sigma subunit)
MAETSVLLADDDDIGRYVVATVLRRAGFAVREVPDGFQAVSSAKADPPDLAILDVKMPGMDGFAACRELKSDPATRHIPVLMLSATFLESEARVEGLETGADAYLTQPVEAPVLAATVRSLLRARSLEVEVRLAAAEWQTTFEAISDAVGVLGPTGVVERANGAFLACFGEGAVGTRVAVLDQAREDGELVLGDRIFSVRSDAVRHADVASNLERVVVTLSDVTAARRIERERASALAIERTISRTLQQTLLPTRLPQRPDLAIDAWHVAAELELIVGGDWYDVIETGRGLWLVIGDVAGHGVAATAQAGQLRHSLRVYAHEGFGLAESATRLNELLTGDELARMATLCIVAVEDDPNSVGVVCAGHPQPVLVPAPGRGPAALADCPSGVVLGLIGTQYVETRIPFEAGDRLVLYTDGLMERPGEIIDDSLERVVRATDGVEGLVALRAHLVDEFVGSAQPRDDIALLLAERRAAE